MTSTLRSSLLALVASLAALGVAPGCVESHTGMQQDAGEDGSTEDAAMSYDAAVPADAGTDPDGSGQCVPLGDPCTDVTECCGYPPSVCSEVYVCDEVCDVILIPC